MIFSAHFPVVTTHHTPRGGALAFSTCFVPMQPRLQQAATTAVAPLICPQDGFRKPMICWISQSGSGDKRPQYRSKYVRNRQIRCRRKVRDVSFGKKWLLL